MTKHAKTMAEAVSQLSTPGRAASKRMKTVPLRFKATTFEVDSEKNISGSKRVTKKKRRFDSSTTQTLPKTTANECQRTEVENQSKGEITKNKDGIASQTTKDLQTIALISDEEDEFLLPIKRRRLRKLQQPNVVTDEDEELPIKLRRLRKLGQPSTMTKEDKKTIWTTEEQNDSISDDKKKSLKHRLPGKLNEKSPTTSTKGAPLLITGSINAAGGKYEGKQGLDRKPNSRHQMSAHCWIDGEEQNEFQCKDEDTGTTTSKTIEIQDGHVTLDDNEMATDDGMRHKENKRTWIPINSLEEFKREWTIKVMVIRRGMTEQYNTERGCGTRWKTTLMDEEGTCIDAIAFNQAAECMEQMFSKGKTYFVSNAVPKLINKMFPSAHDKLEIFLSEQTEVEEAIQNISLQRLQYTPITMNNLKVHAMKNSIVDVFGIVSSVGKITEVPKRGGMGTSTRRSVVIMNESCVSVPLTLWGDLAKIEGAELQEIEEQIPVVGVFKVRASYFRGELCLSSLAMTSLHINPPLLEADTLKNSMMKEMLAETKAFKKVDEHSSLVTGVAAEEHQVQDTSVTHMRRKIKTEKE